MYSSRGKELHAVGALIFVQWGWNGRGTKAHGRQARRHEGTKARRGRTSDEATKRLREGRVGATAPRPRGLPGRNVCGCQRAPRGRGIHARRQHLYNIPPDRFSTVRKRSVPMRRAVGAPALDPIARWDPEIGDCPSLPIHLMHEIVAIYDKVTEGSRKLQNPYFGAGLDCVTEVFVFGYEHTSWSHGPRSYSGCLRAAAGARSTLDTRRGCDPHGASRRRQAGPFFLHPPAAQLAAPGVTQRS